MQLSEWLQGIANRLVEVMAVDTLESCGPMLCLTHGDLWTNNFM